MNSEKRGRPRKRGSKQGEVLAEVDGFQFRPSSYQPTKAELEEPIRLDASLDEIVDALFAGDRKRRQDC